MITVDASVRRTDGVGLVTVLVENSGDRPRTVRLRATVPVMPPRRQGTPERGWNGREVTLRVPAEARRSVGFATDDGSLGGDDSPVELVDRSVADDRNGGVASDPDAVVRSLSDGRPPADAVPVDDPGVDSERGDGDCDEETAPEATADWEWVGESAPVEPRSGAGPSDDRSTDEKPACPKPVADWLASVERRCDRVERVTGTAPLSTATTALDEAGGLGALTDEADGLAADARRLRALAARAERLAERVERASLPRDTLEALA